MARKIHQQTRSERATPGGREITFEFREGDLPTIPAILQLPTSAKPVPAALLLHGLTSRKEVLAGSIGTELLRRGVASLAIDLPLHGGRGTGLDGAMFRNPLQVVAQWRQAKSEARLALRYLAARPEIDAARLALLGYSLGAQVATAVAAREPDVRALVVAAGGDLPDGTALSGMARSLADPLAAVRRLKGRPLLMVHGRADRTVSPAQAERLFAAAGEPKEIRWYDSGHRLPTEAAGDVALWLVERLR
jgi:uncharacterized protein